MLLNRKHVGTLFLGLLTGLLISYCVVCWEMRDVKLAQRKESIFSNHLLVETENRTLADEIARKVKILCIVAISYNSDIRPTHIKETWGKRCNILLFTSSSEDKSIPTVKVPYESKSWAYTKYSLSYIYKYYYNDVDWFFMTEISTYAVLENLRYMLYNINPNSPAIFGSNDMTTQMNIQAGFILSKEALRKFVEVALHKPHICQGKSNEDVSVELLRCLTNVGVKQLDVLDTFHKTRYFPISFSSVPGNFEAEVFRYQNYYKCLKGIEECISATAVVFFKVSSSELYVIEYLIYHLRPYGKIFEAGITNGRLGRVENQ